MKTKFFSSYFKKLDIFGEDITFNFGGNRHYTTVVGAIVSILVVLVVFIYGQGKFFILLNRGDTSH